MGEKSPQSAVENAYALAKERYAEFGVDTQLALSKLEEISISLHCWQGDDVAGFEDPERGLSGGIMAKRAMQPNYAKTWIRRTVSFLAIIDLTYTRCIMKLVKPCRAMKSNQPILQIGWIGRKRIIMVSISILHASPTHCPMMDLP